MDFRVRGRGVAALTALMRLADVGRKVTVEGPTLPNPLNIGLNVETVGLIEDVFGIQLSDLPDARWIKQRIIRGWHPSEETLESPTLSLPAASMVDKIQTTVVLRHQTHVSWLNGRHASNGFLLNSIGATSDRNVPSPEQLIIGRRVATFAAVQVTGENKASILEKTKTGWMFLLPALHGNATLFAVVARTECDPNSALESNLRLSPIGDTLEKRGSAAEWRVVAPSIQYPLATRTRLRIGEAAFTFDPLCGDGTGYAVRTGLLASVISTNIEEGDFSGLNYYQARLFRAFQAHLRACITCYSELDASGWSDELSDTRKALAFLQTPKVTKPIK